jgi:hypothetical protein
MSNIPIDTDGSAARHLKRKQQDDFANSIKTEAF